MFYQFAQFLSQYWLHQYILLNNYLAQNLKGFPILP